MKESFVKKQAAVVLFLVLLFIPISAKALVNLQGKASAGTLQVGDIAEINITVSGSKLSVIEGSLTYDPEALEFLDGEGGVSDGYLYMVSMQKGGSDTLSARLRFKAISAKETKIEFLTEKALDYNGKEQGSAKLSLSLNILALPQEPKTPPIDYSTRGVLALNVKDAEENMFILRSLENVTLPSRYSPKAFTYHGEAVAAAVVEESDAPMLLYLTNASGSLAGYYIYNDANDYLYPYSTISSASKTYILLEPDGNVERPEGFVETTLEIDGKAYPALKRQDAQGDVYLLYGRNPKGELGYYMYSFEDDSLIRYAVLPVRPVAPTFPKEEPEPAPVEEQAAPPEPEQIDTLVFNKTMFYIVSLSFAILFCTVLSLLIVSLKRDAQRRQRAALRRAELERAYPEQPSQ
ncbi:MAG TPA: cohesin domain-containing protein [Clostridia bacterium]|nr:cohesin domain-containing protein [Clostridia bacterium]